MFAAEVTTVTYRGARSMVRLTGGSLSIEAEVAHAAGQAPDWVVPGARVACEIPRSSVLILPDASPVCWGFNGERRGIVPARVG